MAGLRVTAAVVPVVPLPFPLPTAVQTAAAMPARAENDMINSSKPRKTFEMTFFMG